MTHSQRNKIIRDRFRECKRVLKTKGADYSHGEDANANFKRTADMINKPSVDKYTVWLVLFSKHLDAIETFINDRELKSEPIESRITDAINYLAILETMIKEDEELVRA